MSRTVANVVPTGAPPLRMSYEAWLAWNDEDVRSEWVDGEVIVSVSTSVRHAEIAGFFYVLLSHYARFFDRGRVLAESVEMKLDHAARVPDVLFVARRNLGRLSTQRLQGPADLVVEIVSPDSVERDRAQKLGEYRAAGVPEYWLFDPLPAVPETDCYQLIDGVYRAVPPDPDGRYHSLALPGFWFRPAWLMADPLPDPLDCLLDIAPQIFVAKLHRVIDPGADPGN